MRDEKAPFDRPEIAVPNGHPGDESVIDCIDPAEGDAAQACDAFLNFPAVGAGGRRAAGLDPVGTFLDLDHLEEEEGEEEEEEEVGLRFATGGQARG